MIHLMKSGDPETRESVTKKSRVRADMEISAIEALTNAKFEIDRALDKASKTLHRLLEEIPLESEAATKAEELNSIRDKRVSTLRCVRAKPTPRGFEEDVKDEDVFASATMTASMRMLLSQALDLRNEGYTVFTADVKTAFLNADVKGGVRKTPPPEWQPETLDPSKGTKSGTY